MKHFISDLKDWPIGVWIASGSGRMIPEFATAKLRSVKVKGSEIHLTVVDRDGEYSSVLIAENVAEAKRAGEALSGAVNARLEDSGRVEFEVG